MTNIYTHNKKLNWADACALPAKLNVDKYLGFDDWILLPIEQLKVLQLSELCASEDKCYWSSSPYAGYPYNAWYFNFSNGVVDNGYHTVHNYVRLVRASQLAEIGQLALEKIGMSMLSAPVVKYEHPHADLIFQWADLVAKGEVDKGWWEVLSTRAEETKFKLTTKTNTPYWNIGKIHKIVKTDNHPDSADIELTISLPFSYVENMANQVLTPSISVTNATSLYALDRIIEQAKLKLSEGAK